MSPEDLSDLFQPFAAVTTKRMFGGTSVYVFGMIIAIEVDGLVYMKADDVTQPAFETAGLKQFSYEAKGKTMTMRYWQLPDAAYEDADALEPWFRLALEAAKRSPVRGGAAKPKKAR